MSQPNASSHWRGSGEPQPVARPRTRHQSSVGWWWWVQVGALCLLICCAVALMFVLLIPPLAVNPGLPTVIGYSPSAGAQFLLTGATLGGTLAGFDAAYGAPTHTSDDGARWERAAIAGQQVALAIAFADGQDGQLHVTGVSASPAAPASATWDTATASTVVSALLPADSHFVRDDTSLPHFLTRIYTSAALAVTWGAAPFVNDAGQPTPLGEFSVGCQINSAGRVTACFMSPGPPS